MTDNRLKLITIRAPIELLARMSEIRKNEGTSVTFQFNKGAELYLAQKEKGKK